MERIQYNRIKEVLDEKNKDVYWLQNQLEGETIPCVVRWCKNVKQPTIEQLFEIARVLEVDVRELIVSTDSQFTPHNSNSNIEKQHKSETEELSMGVKREILPQFQGRNNVRHIISDNGAECFLSQEVCFADETTAKGACKLNTVENETKHVLFLFNSNDEEVGRYYLGKKLQGKTPSELVEMKQNLCFFESWNPESSKWVPCVGLSGKESNQNDKEGCGRVTIFRDGYYSVIDKQGNIIVPTGRYTYIDGFDHNLARVKIDGMTSINNPKESTFDKWGIIDIDGKEVLPVKYSEIWLFYKKNRQSTRVYEGEFEEGKYYPKSKEYRFDFNGYKLIDVEVEEWDRKREADIDYNYSIMDALDGEPEAAGNIDYEW